MYKTERSNHITVVSYVPVEAPLWNNKPQRTAANSHFIVKTQQNHQSESSEILVLKL